MNLAFKNAAICIVVGAMLFTCGCNSDINSQNASSNNSSSVRADDEPQKANSSWPTDAIGIVEHLNDWHHDELVAYNEPDKFPNFKTSGETNGWISAHEEELAKLDVRIRWDHEQQKYMIVTAN